MKLKLREEDKKKRKIKKELTNLLPQNYFSKTKVFSIKLTNKYIMEQIEQIE